MAKSGIALTWKRLITSSYTKIIQFLALFEIFSECAIPLFFPLLGLVHDTANEQAIGTSS